MAAFVAYLGLILAPLATAGRLHPVAARPGLRRVCLVLGLLTATGVMAWVGGVAGEAGGALQRAATTIGGAWYICDRHPRARGRARWRWHSGLGGRRHSVGRRRKKPVGATPHEAAPSSRNSPFLVPRPVAGSRPFPVAASHATVHNWYENRDRHSRSLR
ncbi:MAG: hypothetical protein M3N32_05685 [Actinomycetota bacterium]|nr:hypothetical protein [Actinomycetota bacterium]